MAHLQESGRLSRSRCRLWIMFLVASSYARNQNMGRCDLSTWSQISMAHRQKQFQVKSLAKNWNSITSLRSGIFRRNKLKGVHSQKKTRIPMAHLQESGRLSRSRCKLWIMSLVAFSYARNQKMGRCDLSTWRQIPMAQAIPGQKLSQALKQHRQLAFWYFQKKQNKGCPFSKKNPNGTLAGEWKTFTKSLQTLNHVVSLHLASGIRIWEGTTCQLGVKSQGHTAKSNSRSKA